MYLSFLVKFVFFKSDLPCTQIWLSPRFSHISCFCQYCNQIVPQTPLQTLKIFKLGWNLKICLGGSLATSNVCVFTERGILEQPHSLKDFSFLVKFWLLKSDWFWTQIWLLPGFSQIYFFYNNCNQIAPQRSLQTLKFFKLGCNLKICLGGSLATSNFCVLTQWDFGTTSYSEIFEFFGEICIF